MRRHPAAAAVSGLLAAVMPHSMDPPRCILTVRLPSQGIPCICALTGSRGSTAAGTGSSKAAGTSAQLVAVTAEGILYEYHIKGLRSASGPLCALEGECLLLGQSM